MARPNVPEVPVYEAPGTIAWKGLRPGMAASGRKRTLIPPNFRQFERPLSRKADIPEYPQDFHKIDQLGTSAFRSKADIKLILVKGSANNPKRTSRLATDIIPDMSLLDLIIEKTGVRIASDSVASDYEAQILIASLLALVARSDGGILPDENLRIVNLLCKRFGLRSGEALDLVARAADDRASHAQLDESVDPRT